jgi:PPOX class probable F420-dependent enzyme
MKKIQGDDVKKFMRSGAKTGKHATVRSDGSPHIAAIWFAFDHETKGLVFLTEETSLKCKNIQRDPRVSVLAADETFPFGWARMDGVTTTSTADLLHWATESCRRYVGDHRADEYGCRNGVPGEVVVRVRATKLVGKTELAS